MASRDVSPRKARVCTKSGCGRRSFGSLGWVCPEHGSFHTVDQPDHLYFGKVPTLESKP